MFCRIVLVLVRTLHCCSQCLHISILACFTVSPGSAVYNLYAVSNHSGTTMGGHYTAYCCNPDSGEWYTFNDSRYSYACIRQARVLDFPDLTCMTFFIFQLPFLPAMIVFLFSRSLSPMMTFFSWRKATPVFISHSFS